MASQLFKFGLNKPSPMENLGSPKMAQDISKLEMSDSIFADLREIIYKLCGIYYTESKKYLLEGRIAKRLIANKMNSYEEYIRFLNSPSSRTELESLFEVITINETYFFRAPQQFEAFENIIVPEILKARAGLPSPIFRIWSAASSSGEEAYTTAIIILERLKPMFPNVQFQVMGSDINTTVLDSARKGIYKEYAVRNIPPHLLKKYFTQNGTNYLLSDSVKRLVKFTSINLYDSMAVRSIVGCDVIFCANVLIYFDTPSKQQVVSNLYNSLNKNGYLFIGYSESLHGVSKAFKLVHLPKAMAYQKE